MGSGKSPAVVVGAILERLAELSIGVVNALGYPGVFLLMALESMIFPVPSEAVMPPAGILAARGEMSMLWIFVWSTLGTVAGSLASYWMGAKLGAPVIERYGKYFLLHKGHLEMAHRFFDRWGGPAIFVARFIPGVRHVVSIPAGVARMHLAPFIVYTTVGGAMWNMILAYAGFRLGENWESVVGWLHAAGEVLLVVFVLAVLVIAVKLVKERRARGAGPRVEPPVEPPAER